MSKKAKTSKAKTSNARLTLRDLAAHADVSPATVSLVLRKSPLVAQVTRERVLASIETLGYVYNRGAASLRTQRTHTVGVAINELANPYFAELTAAIERAFNAIGYSVFLSNSAEDPARQDQFIDTMREYNVDGLIICPAAGTTAKSMQRLIRFNMPCVQVSRYVRGVALDFAGNDNVRGTYLATEHLIALGHRRIAMIGGNEITSTGWERLKGYTDALKAHGIAIDDELIVPAIATRENGADAIKTLLKRPNPPTAAACYNDLIAFGVLLGLRQIGIEPGGDFAVVGCDDVSEAALWHPALSSIAVGTAAMGDVAARMLMERIADHGAKRREIVLEPKLVVRASSGGMR
ncbi:MAG: LacI family DNA-binding transcriptional regulator [Pseudolabrys sp.]|nr:LacI family DNA-binding transcriptional regulator [Pseudolabrys sp.]